MRLRVLGVAILVLLAGCSAQSTPSTTQSQTTALDTTTPATTQPTTTTQSNPWDADTLTVATAVGEYNITAYETAVEDATAYWNQHDSRIPYDTTLEFEPNATNADIVVTYDHDIVTCSDDQTTTRGYYCADTPSPDESLTDPAHVRLEAGYTNTDTTRLAKHALSDILSVPALDDPDNLQAIGQPVLRNPWPDPGPVVVTVDHRETNTVPEKYWTAAQRAIEYWNNNSTRYTTHQNVTFELRKNTKEADVRIDLTDTLAKCGSDYSEATVGCAPIHDTGDRASPTSVVEIKTGYTLDSTTETMQHEFGHLLGLEHSDDPMPLMAAVGETTLESSPDAVNRSFTFETTSLDVAILGSPSPRERDQVLHALEYYESGADGWFGDGPTPSFTVVDDETDAHIIINVTNDNTACDSDLPESCFTIYGIDEDTDDALEYYREARITTADIENDRLAWHVGSWLGDAVGASSLAENPDPLDGENDDRDGDWWT